jgi:hypothetical protein
MVVLMRSNGIIMGLLVVLAMCSLTSMALDTKVYTLCENNLSINLTPGFQIIPDKSNSQTDGAFSQGFTIVSSQSKGTAMLQIMDVYDEDTQLFGPEFISQTWIMGVSIGASMLSMNEDDSNRIIGNWTATDSMGNNVTVSTMSTNNSLLSVFGKTADVSNWNIGENKYAGLVSFFDRNTTRQIIGTLKLS